MKEDFFIRVLNELKQESKCVSWQVGALIVKDGRLISTGYNGTLKGAPNCCDVYNSKNFDRAVHSKWSASHEIHAEANAIAMAVKSGIQLDKCACYCSLQPCTTCLLLIIQSGIKEIIYVDDYDRSGWTPELLNNIKRLGIILRKYK